MLRFTVCFAKVPTDISRKGFPIVPLIARIRARGHPAAIFRRLNLPLYPRPAGCLPTIPRSSQPPVATGRPCVPPPSKPASPDHDAGNRPFAERLAGRQPVQPGHQDEAIAIPADQDGRLQAYLQDTLGDLFDGLGV